MRKTLALAATILAALSACTATPSPQSAAAPAGAPNALSEFPALAAAGSCEGAEIFGAGSAFSCDRGACVKEAHDRAEKSCPENCDRWHDCPAPLECTGDAKRCYDPLVVEFSTSACPHGVGYFCSGACVCKCACAHEA